MSAQKEEQRITFKIRELHMLRVCMQKCIKDISKLDVDTFGDTYEKIDKAINKINKII